MRNGNGKNPQKNPRFNGAPLEPGNPGNSGGKAGRSGRKPDAFREICADLLESAKTRASVRKILADDGHPHFATIYKHLTDHAYGKPTQPLGNPDSGEIVVRVIRQEAAVTFD